MKIVKLTAENIKKLRAVEITPDGEVVTVAGKNGQGKTSVLDSIWWALAGTTHIQKEPIRRGQDTARVRLDLGELVVERRFTKGGSTLTVESVEGARYPSPQKMLDALVGELSFDPLAFARMDAAKQFDELRRVAKVEIDIPEIEALNRSDYAKRTEVNRRAKERRAQASAITVPNDLPAEPLDESALLDAIQEAADANARIERRKAKRADTARQVEDSRQIAQQTREKANDLRREADRLDAAATASEKEADDLQKKLDSADPLPAPTDIAEIRALLDTAKITNANIALRDKREMIEGEALALENDSKALTTQMEAREVAKRDAIMAAAMPVDGLGFGEGFVTFNEVPFDQASSAEQLRVSLALAMAANPKLRVIRIEDGSLLDEDSLAQIATMAKDSDYQVWIERVETSGSVSVIIEDGAVKA